MLYAVLLTLLYVVSWTYYTKYQIEERRLPDAEEEINLIPSKNWHKWKFVNQLAFFGMAALAVGPANAFILSVIYWVAFDALIAEVVLGKPYYYLGGTATMDKYFKGLINEKTFFYLRCAVAIILVIAQLVF